MSSHPSIPLCMSSFTASMNLLWAFPLFLLPPVDPPSLLCTCANNLDLSDSELSLWWTRFCSPPRCSLPVKMWPWPPSPNQTSQPQTPNQPKSNEKLNLKTKIRSKEWKHAKWLEMWKSKEEIKVLPGALQTYEDVSSEFTLTWSWSFLSTPPSP